MITLRTWQIWFEHQFHAHPISTNYLYSAWEIIVLDLLPLISYHNLGILVKLDTNCRKLLNCKHSEKRLHKIRIYVAVYWEATKKDELYYMIKSVIIQALVLQIFHSFVSYPFISKIYLLKVFKKAHHHHRKHIQNNFDKNRPQN